MARGSATKTDIINAALRRCGKSKIADADQEQGTNEAAQDALLFYKLRYEELLEVFPWSFATKRPALTRRSVPAGDSTGMRYFYELPVDGVFLWDIYPVKGYAREYTDNWDFNQYDSIAFPITSLVGFTFNTNIGEFLDGKIYSNYDTMYCLYTHNSPVRTQDFGTSFRKCLENAIVDSMQEGRQKDAQALDVIFKKNADENKTMFSSKSVENRRNLPKVPRCQTLQKMDRWS